MKLEATMEEHLEDNVTDGSLRGVSKRRANKHLIERRRRARINSSLTQLKTLVLEGLKKDPARYNRLEKADILEMTVNHLKTLKSQQNNDTMESLVSRYQAGFTECAGEVAHFLNDLPKIEDSVKSNILSHMNDCLLKMGQSLGVATADPTGTGSAAMSFDLHQGHDPSLPLDLSRSGTERLKQSDRMETQCDAFQMNASVCSESDVASIALRTNCDAISGLQVGGRDVTMRKDSGVESVDSGLDDEVSSNDDNQSNDLKTDDCANFGNDGNLEIRQEDMWRPW